ncbi:uncharacterized protein LOC126474526, partial [Schistocerca serialis cubense]|uniref:uncharacterized protein LOC126474526 n=1 Tax=Schistocerca serialis cubense TaxID=2023355 RepID=UPI00214E5E20
MSLPPRTNFKLCPPPKECCAQGCCAYRPPLPLPPATSFVFWNHWYFGILLLLLVASCAGGCGLWRRGRSCCCGCGPQDDDAAGSDAGAPSGSLRSSAGSCCPPPHYSRCSSLHRAPPPYTEVTSKPDLYPLVISYGDAPKGSVGNSYLMVQYFRNYIVRPVGSLSAASTADSLSSSFLCSAANEANTAVPPPYSSAGSLDGLTSASGPAGAADMAGVPVTVSPEADRRAPSASSSATASDVSSLAGSGSPGSPPRATSPT